MNEISNDLIQAVQRGQLKTVQDLVNQYGLSHSEQWEDGYVLLCNSIKFGSAEITEFLIKSGAKVNSKTCETIKATTPLHYVVQNFNKDILVMLLERGANVNAKDAECRTPLLLAIMQQKESFVEILLENGANVSGDKLLKHDSSYVNSTCNLYKGFTPLHFAVKNREERIAMLLIKHGANVDALSHNMSTPLHIATRKEYFKAVELLLMSGACVNAKTTEGLTPLHFASEKGNVELMILLLENKADIDPCSNVKMTPLCLAANGSHEEAVKFLLFNRANVDAEDENGKSVLCFGVETGSEMIVKAILKHFPDKSKASNKNALKIAAKGWVKNYLTIVKDLLAYGFSVEPEDINDSALMENCVRMGYIEILRDLLKQGIDLSCYKDLNTLLNIAVQSRQTEVAKFLLNNGADVNATDNDGNSPIFYSTVNSDVTTTEVLLSHGANIKKSPELLLIASIIACKKMVELLLQNQADIEATDQFGRTALHLTALNEYDSYLFTYEKYNPDFKAKEEIFKLLLKKGANVNAKIDNDGFTALHIACQRNLKNFVEVLLNFKADVNCIVTHLTPLHIAAQNGDSQIVEMLLANGADVNARRENGETSLFTAAKKGHLDVINILLEYDADIESEDMLGARPLHSAASQDNYETVALLLDHGASIDAQDKEGKTALHIASKLRKSRTVELLLKLGSDINIQTNNNCTPSDLTNGQYFLKRPQFQIYNLTENKVSEILEMHLIMLKTANLYINEKYSRFLNEVPDVMAFYEERYKKEIERMKNENLGRKNLSWYDVLTTKNSCLLGKYVKNEDIRGIIDSSSYKVGFPNYACMIERNLKRGVERNRLLEVGQEFFIRHFELPYHCSDQILSYLSDDDLKTIKNIYKLYILNLYNFMMKINKNISESYSTFATNCWIPYSLYFCMCMYSPPAASRCPSFRNKILL